MCRKKMTVVCSELGDDSTKWSRHSPLLTPEWFRESLIFFAKSVELLAQGEHAEALTLLQKTREGEIREFYVDHGQRSSYFRYRGVTKSKVAQRVSKNVTPRRIPSIEREVFKRDKYCCRYCGIGVIPKEFLKKYAKAIGVENFPIGKTNDTRHGVVLGFRAVADHVHPYSDGGQTDASNLVTSCMSCNYGKKNYTFADLELDDPRDRNPVGIPGWNGLTDVNI